MDKVGSDSQQPTTSTMDCEQRAHDALGAAVKVCIRDSSYLISPVTTTTTTIIITSSRTVRLPA